MSLLEKVESIHLLSKLNLHKELLDVFPNLAIEYIGIMEVRVFSQPNLIRPELVRCIYDVSRSVVAEYYVVAARMEIEFTCGYREKLFFTLDRDGDKNIILIYEGNMYKLPRPLSREGFGSIVWN